MESRDSRVFLVASSAFDSGLLSCDTLPSRMDHDPVKYLASCSRTRSASTLILKGHGRAASVRLFSLFSPIVSSFHQPRRRGSRFFSTTETEARPGILSVSCVSPWCKPAAQRRKPSHAETRSRRDDISTDSADLRSLVGWAVPANSFETADERG